MTTQQISKFDIKSYPFVVFQTKDAFCTFRNRNIALFLLHNRKPQLLTANTKIHNMKEHKLNTQILQKDLNFDDITSSKEH